LNRELLFSRRGGAAGWLAFPFALVFECLSPVVECLGWVYFAAGFFTGYLDWELAIAFLVVNFGFGSLLSVTSLLLDEISNHTYPRQRQIFVLLVAAVVENVGFRQLTACWRLVGLVQWLTGAKARWGVMTRSADCTSQVAPASSPVHRR
jgi:hypothetical protein